MFRYRTYQSKIRLSNSVSNPGQWGEEGGAASIVIPRHARFVGLGDSITSQVSTKGLRNWVACTSFFLGGKLRPAVGMDQGKGGNTMAQILARINYTIGIGPEVILGMWGHNDGFATGTTATRIASNRAILDGLRTGLPDAIIVWHACLPSDVGTEDATVLSDFNDDGEAWCLADGNAIYIPVPTGFDHALHTEDGTHPNNTGGLFVGRAAAALLDTYIEAGGDVLDEVTAAGEFGANLDTEYALTGTSGTKTGTVTPTGNVATGKEVNNALTNGTSVAVACDNQTVAGQQRIDVTGTPASENNVVWDESSGSNVTLSAGGVDGRFFEYLIGFTNVDTDGSSAPSGLLALGSAAGSLGNAMSVFSTGATDPVAEVISGVLRTSILPMTTAGALAISASVTARFPAVPIDSRIILTKPILRQVELVAYKAPFYVGGDTVIGPGNTVRITGTASSGSVLTGNPGTWAGGACVPTYQWKRYNAGTNVFDSNIAGATSLTYTLTGSEVGFKIGLTVTMTNSFGAVSQDSALTATVT